MNNPIYLVFFTVALISCNYDSVDVDETECIIEVTYSGVVKDIINQNCAYSPCHNGSGDGPGDFRTYDGLETYLESGLFKERAVDIRDMPPNNAPGPKQLSPTEIDILKCWIKDDYPR